MPPTAGWVVTKLQTFSKQEKDQIDVKILTCYKMIYFNKYVVYGMRYMKNQHIKG